MHYGHKPNSYHQISGMIFAGFQIYYGTVHKFCATFQGVKLQHLYHKNRIYLKKTGISLEKKVEFAEKQDLLKKTGFIYKKT